MNNYNQSEIERKQQTLGNISSLMNFNVDEMGYLCFDSVDRVTLKVDTNEFPCSLISMIVITDNQIIFGIEGSIKQIKTYDNIEQAIDLAEVWASEMGSSIVRATNHKGVIYYFNKNNVTVLVKKESECGKFFNLIVCMLGIDQNRTNNELSQQIAFIDKEARNELSNSLKTKW